ncbi:MAG: hypothetical protein LBP79_00640 [Clostridiales bacterium]|nr:hypothetical protein [Clostridiales bacterium]
MEKGAVKVCYAAANRRDGRCGVFKGFKDTKRGRGFLLKHAGIKTRIYAKKNPPLTAKIQRLYPPQSRF